MKKTISTLFVAIFFLATLTQAQTQAQVKGQKSALLWEISGNGLSSPSYLFGTIHMIPAENYVLTDIMKEKFATCKTLALEVDIDMDMKQKIELAQQVLLPNKKTIDEFMTPDDYKKFEHWVRKDLKIKKRKFKQMQKIKPFLPCR